MRNSFIREKVIHAGEDYLYPQIFPYTGTQIRGSRASRGKKVNVSAPKQKNLNERRAKRYFIQLVNANFGQGDLAVHLSYSPEHLPQDEEEAGRIVARYLRRVSYERKKQGLEPLKYVCVTQLGRKKNGSHRIHHHILMNGGLDRDTVESLWWASKGNKKLGQPPERYGFANADRLQPGKNGLEAIARYITQDGAGKKHWTQSQNLDKPWHRNPNDTKYSRRQIERIAEMPEDCEEFRAFWERQYKGYELVGVEKVLSQQTGWYFYLSMRRKEQHGRDAGGLHKDLRGVRGSVHRGRPTG